MRIGLKIAVLLSFILCFTFLNRVTAQVSIDVKMDTNMLMIGDQTNVIFEARFPDSITVNLPVFSDTIIDKLEILDITDIDTVKENQFIKISQKYLVTIFDSGWYAIPPIDFAIGHSGFDRVDTIQSKAMYFGVMTMPLDTANAESITDIKAPIGAPVTFKEVLPFVGAGFGLLLLILLGYVLYMKFAKKEKIFVKREKPKEPAHLIAFRNLDALKDEKLWQKGHTKQYYSRLTEIIRTYIEDRFGILAMESTTDEIIDAFRLSKDIDKELKDGLFDTLVRADFVKFAKAEALADENEQSLNFAYKFVSSTKVVEELRENDEKNKSENTDLSTEEPSVK